MNAHELHGPNEVIIRGVRGLWPEDEYVRALEECRQRLRSGVLGKRSEHFTYWTSATVSKAVVLLALAKYANLVPVDV